MPESDGLLGHGNQQRRNLFPRQCQDLFPLLNVQRHIIRLMPAAYVRQVFPGHLQQARVLAIAKLEDLNQELP